jgi:hypothetical protein
MTIHQTIEIPADRRVRLDFMLPKSLPSGKTKIKVEFTQAASLSEKFAGFFSRRVRFEKHFDEVFGCCKDKDIWGGDSVEVIRKMRDAW